MGNGLLAEWQRGLVVRGAVAVALLALPVGVAAAIGFSPSASGLSEGLGSLATGPAEPPPAASRGDSVDSAISSVAAPTGAAAPGQAGDGAGLPGIAGVESPGGATTAPGPDGVPPAGVVDAVPGQVTPDADDAADAVPDPAPGTETIDQVLGEAVNRLFGAADAD